MITSNSKEEREKETAEQVALQIMFSNKFDERIRREISKVAVIAAKTYIETSNLPGNFVVHNHQKSFERIFSIMYRQIITAFSKRNFKEIRNLPPKNINGFEIPQERSHWFSYDKKQEEAVRQTFAELMQNWISTNALAQAKIVSKTTQNDIVGVISTGVEEGLSNQEISRNIIDKVGIQLAKSRADMIAITETHNAAIFADLESTKLIDREFDLKVKKRWIPVEDQRTRPDHAMMFNVPAIAMDDFFIVGGANMDRPGDPAAPPEQVIRCRCVLVYEE